ncbi:hypothetical protein ABPG72_014852 [Tetrahymena utriculariae]
MQSMSNLQNESNDDFYKDIRSIIEDIRVNFLFMTKEVLMKTNRFINKQIIDSIKNYFFENQIGTLLKPKMEKDSLKKVKSEIEDNIKCDPENRYQDPEIPKYMIFMNAYVDQIEKYALHQDYLNLLYDLILSDNQSKGFSDDWMTLIRKKITAVLLLGHFQSSNRSNLKNIFDLWANVYPNQQLNKVKKNFKNSKQSTNQIASEENQKQLSSSDSDSSETEDQEVMKEQIKESKQKKSQDIKNSKAKKQFQQPSIQETQDLDISKLKQPQQEIDIRDQKNEEIKVNEISQEDKQKNNRGIKQKSTTSTIKNIKSEKKQDQQLQSNKQKRKKDIKSVQNQYAYNQNECDETSYSPLMQGAQAEIYIAETQFILDHEEEEEEEEEDDDGDDDGEETNPQNFFWHASIIQVNPKVQQQPLQKINPSKKIVKQRKTQKLLKQKQKKQIQVKKEKIVALNQLNCNQNSFNDEKTTSMRQYSIQMQQNREIPQQLREQECQYIKQEQKNSSEKGQKHENTTMLIDDQNLYFQNCNYSLLSSQISDQKISNQYYNCYSHADQQQILLNVNSQNQHIQNNSQQTLNLQQNNETNMKSEQNNQLLYNNKTTIYTNQNIQNINNITNNTSYYQNQNNHLNNQETDLQSNYFNYFNQNNRSFIQGNIHNKQNSFIINHEIAQRDESQEIIIKPQQFSPLHFSDQDTIQNKNQHHETYSQEYQDYLNFDHEIQNQNICFSLCDFNAYDSYKNFYKEQDYSQDLKMEIQKCSPNNVFNNQYNIQEEQSLLNQQNNQIQLEIQQNNSKQIHEYEKQFEINNQSSQNNKKSQQIWKNLSQRMEDKTEITISQDQQQGDEQQEYVSDESSNDDVYKETISVDDQEDDLLTQSF